MRKTWVFPIITAAYFAFPSDPDDQKTEEFLRAQVPGAAGATDLEVEIDGVPVRDVERFYEESDVFSVALPDNNLFGLDAGFELSPAVDAGYYLAVAPLLAGQHTVHIHGERLDAMPCTYCSAECPGVLAEAVPVVGDLDLPGCCLPTGRCGVSNLGLPAVASGPPSCRDEAGLAELLGFASPNPPIAVPASACEAPGARPDLRCPQPPPDGAFPDAFGCCTPDGTCGFALPGSECMVTAFGDAPLPCDQASP